MNKPTLAQRHTHPHLCRRWRALNNIVAMLKVECNELSQYGMPCDHLATSMEQLRTTMEMVMQKITTDRKPTK